VNRFIKWFYQLGTPRFFYPLTGKLSPWLAGISLLLLAVGSYWGLFVAPADYQQGEAFRIIYVHVPAAWLSMFVYAM
jgi:heme exporter protein C